LKYFTEDEVKNLDVGFIQKLEKAREIAGVPFVITSGYRLPGDNVTVGGVQDSAHTRGLAVDLRSRSPKSHFAIIKGAIDAGVKRIGYYTDRDGRPTHVHIDGDISLSQDVMWYGISK